MATPPRKTSTVFVGGKGSFLSPAAVYAVSRGLSKLAIDPAALEKLSQLKKHSLKPLSDTPVVQGFLLTFDESRAALAVLLNKLALSEFPVRPIISFLIQETLDLAAGLETLDFGSSLGFLTSLFRLNEKKLDEIGVTGEEINVLESSCAASIAICAILDCCASALVRISDAVAALSSEAVRADVALFDLPVSGDGFSIKDETDVAADMKVFLSGSKLAGKVDAGPFSDVPAVHGSFREAVRLLHGRTRVELNSAMKGKKVTGSGINGKDKAFVASVLPLAMAIQSMSEASFGRAELVVASIVGEDLRSKVGEVFQKECPCIDALRNDFSSITSASSTGSNLVLVLHQVYDLLVKFREILAWESALALFAIEIDESVEKTPVVLLENSKGEKKSEKKKKKILGKGTSIVRHLLKERLSPEADASVENVMTLVQVAHDLAGLFDPKHSELGTLLRKLKEIVESNEVRRLPKIPKGTRDFGKEQMAIRERAFSVIVGVFKKHGAVALDTPVFELRETLMGKYGEDSKLIYDLADQKRGPPLEILSELTSEGSQFLGNSASVAALDELKILFTALDKSKCLNKVVFDLSLARGLDYYTGVIFEAVFKGITQVGSIAAGGRYDNLVGMFSGKVVTAVGVSLGIERVFTIMEQLEKDRNQAIRATETQVLVAILGKDLTLAAELVSELWDAKIKAEFGLTKRVMNHITRAKQSGIPWMVIVGESELQEGVVKLKNIEASEEEVVRRDIIVKELQRRLGIN